MLVWGIYLKPSDYPPATGVPQSQHKKKTHSKHTTYIALLGLLHVHQPFGSGENSDAGNGFTVLLGAGGVFRLGWHRWGTALLMV